MKSKTWTTTESIVVDEIVRFDGKASPEQLREALTNTPYMVSDVNPMVLGYVDGELIAWIHGKDDTIFVCHKNDCIIRYGENFCVFPADMVVQLLKRYQQ